MRLLCLSTLFTVAFSVAHAQVGSGRTTVGTSNLDYIAQQLQAGRGARMAINAKGTPFLFPTWSQGRVITSNGPIKNVWLKYNLATNELLWRRPIGDSLSLNILQIKEFALGDSLRGSQVIVRQYAAQIPEATVLANSFFEVLYDAGKSGLLRQRTKELVRVTTGSPSLTDSQPPSWQTKTQYFIKSPQNTFTPVRLTEKSILAAIAPAKAANLTDYLKQEHLALKKETDVVKLLAYYDTL